MNEIVRGSCSVTRTKRRRFLWCAWWTGEPREDPFRPPDAWSGGARTEDEAQRRAEKAAGIRLEPIEARWARAWLRVRDGLPAFSTREVPLPASQAPSPAGPYAALGIAPGASPEDVKAAFRRKALEHHPDHGGDAATFIAIKRAYDSLRKRQERKKRKGKHEP